MKYRVLIDALDEKGLVYHISSLFYKKNFNILSNNEYVDKENSKFFMRSEIEGDSSIDEIKDELAKALPKSANIRVISPKKKNIILMVTKESHALGDILIRYEAGEMEANILAVISNYDTLKPLVENFGINYHTISHENLSREDHENLVLKQLAQYEDVEYVVLAKYMRILTPAFVSEYEGRLINIHHSFLPAFIGANPYKQAYERGVKIIGATAHFVNNDLDEGPIITQNIVHVNHTQTWKNMQSAGRDVEKIVLSSALKLALEDKIFIYGNKTVIF